MVDTPRGIHTPCTKKYAVFSEDGYCLYKEVRSIFAGPILLILSNIQYFRVVDIAYIKQYALFSGGRMILLVLRNTQYCRDLILNGTGKYLVKISSVKSVYQYVYYTG